MVYHNRWILPDRGPRHRSDSFRLRRNIAPRFQSWKIILEDGRLITGMKVGEDRDGNQFYVDSTGTKHSVSPAEIDVKQADTVSIMPQNLLENLTSQELADLITYLSTLKGIN